MSSEKSKFTSNVHPDDDGLSIDQQLVAIQSSSSPAHSEAHYHPPFVDSSELMAALIVPQATIATNSTSMASQSSQTSPCSQPLLLTLGTSPRLQTLSSQSVPIAHSTHTTIGQNGYNSTGPYLRLIEQPTNRIRYRYKSEKGSHGGLTGENSTQTKKTYPMVRLENYRTSRQILVKASLYTNEENPKPHIHKLMGKYCNEDGICIVPLGENNTAIFQNLGILFVGKKEVPEILFRQKLDEQRLLRALNEESNLSEAEKQKLKEEAEREAKRINLNSVKICFQAFECNNDVHYPICEAIFSRPVANQSKKVIFFSVFFIDNKTVPESPDSGELKIVRMDKYSGVCTGDEEVFLLCEKVNKKEIKIRFFEADSDGSVLWEAFGNFTEADVHHQVAIVFRTPPYRDLNIENAVQVYVQLFRPKDSEYSESRPFTYKPKEFDRECIDIKRKKITHYNPNFIGSHYGQFSGNGRYVGSNDNNPASSTGNDSGLNYYGQANNPHGYYRSNAGCDTKTKCAVDTMTDEFGSKCSLSGHSIRNGTSRCLFSNLTSQTMLTSLRHFAISADLKVLLNPLRELIDVEDENGDTILHLLLIHQPQQSKLISLFVQLAKRLPRNVINIRNNLNQTALHLAVILRKSDLVLELIRNGADANVFDLKGNTALHSACDSGDLSVIKVLLSRQNYQTAANHSNVPNIDQLNYDGLSPLHIAVINGFHSIVEELIQFGANINIREGKGGRNSLQLSLKHVSILKCLLTKNSVDVNQQDYSGNTVLHAACATQNTDAILALIAVDVDLFMENFDFDDQVFEDDEIDELEDQLIPQKGKTAFDYFPDLHRFLKNKCCNDITGSTKISNENETSFSVDSSIFDSGYGSRKINMFDDITLDKICSLLDPPSEDWRMLALYLGVEINECITKDCSPTKQIIERFEKRGTLSMFEAAVDAANLFQVKKLIDNYNSVYGSS